MTFVIVMGFHQIIVVMNDIKRHTYIHTYIVTVQIQNDTSGHVKNYRVIFAVYRFFCPGTNIHARDNKADCDVVVTSNLLPIFLKFILKFFRHVYSFLFFFVLFIHFFFL